MDRWQAMRVFVEVAQAGGLAEAGRRLNMSPPAVTRAVAGLEEVVGARLFTRTTRAVKLTEAGARYYDDCRRLLADLAEADAAAAGSYAKPTGLLTVTASAMFGRMYVLPVMTEFLERHTAVTGRTLFLDRFVNLVDEGVDVAVRIGHLPDSTHSAIKVGSVRRVICGAPNYFEKYGAPQTPRDLAAHRIVAPTAAWASLEWRFGGENRSPVTVHPRLFCNTNDAAIVAAVDGWGLTRVLSYQIGPLLKDGALRTVLDDYEEDALPIHVVHSEGRGASAKVRTFVDLAVERLRANRLFN